MRTRTKPKTILTLFKETLTRWIEDGGPRLGASLAFYTTFSLAPLLLLAIAIAAFFFGQDAAQGKVFEELRSTMGERAASAIQTILQEAQKPQSNTWATLMGLVALVVGASVMMDDLKYTLDKIWRVKERTGFSILIKNKFFSLAMVLLIGFLMLMFLATSIFLAAMSSHQSALPESILTLMNFLLSTGFVTLLFAAIFKLLPSAKIHWRDVWVGAFLTSALFTAGKIVLETYLSQGVLGSFYGTAGSMMVVLLWLYYSAQILYFGAEFTKVYSEQFSVDHKSHPHEKFIAPGRTFP